MENEKKLEFTVGYRKLSGHKEPMEKEANH